MPNEHAIPAPALPRWKAIYDQVFAELPGYAYGSRFYTIADLCTRFEVSRITAIRVLNELAARNLIEKIPGKGNVVRQVTGAVSIRMLLPARMRRDLLTFDDVIRRLHEGVMQAVRELGLDFDTISETHLESLFPRPAGMFGFVVLRSSLQATRFLQDQDLPYVLVDPFDRYRGTTHARADRVAAGYQATQHLLELGHRRIAWITGPLTLPNFRDRIRGYRQALREAGRPFRWSLMKETSGDHAEEDAAALDELLALPAPPTAIIAGDDHRAIHLLHACRSRRLDVPGQLSIVGYPNYPESSLTTPPLTSVDPQFETVGHTAVKLLLGRILGQSAPDAESQLIMPELMLRSSTGPAPQRRRAARTSLKAGA